MNVHNGEFLLTMTGETTDRKCPLQYDILKKDNTNERDDGSNLQFVGALKLENILLVQLL